MQNSWKLFYFVKCFFRIFLLIHEVIKIDPAILGICSEKLKTLSAKGFKERSIVLDASARNPRRPLGVI